MSNFGGLFGVFVILVVTMAQLAGKNKRNNKNRGGNSAQRDDMTLLNRPAEPSGSKNVSKRSWTKMGKKNLPTSATEKISAEETAPSFEVDGSNHSDVQGFDVK